MVCQVAQIGFRIDMQTTFCCILASVLASIQHNSLFLVSRNVQFSWFIYDFRGLKKPLCSMLLQHQSNMAKIVKIQQQRKHGAKLLIYTISAT